MSANTRREFLGSAAAGLFAAAQPFAAVGQTAAPSGLDFPIEDYHVHLAQRQETDPGQEAQDAII